MNITRKIIGLIFICLLMSNTTVNAQQEGFIGEIKMFAGNFAPRGWALCEGQLMDISSNTALFSILGTIYGGDGRTTFGLPDMRGRVPMGAGNGPGLTSRTIGQKGENQSRTLTTLNIPTHNHVATVSLGNAPQNILLSQDNAVKETPITSDTPAVTKFGTDLNAARVSNFGPATNTVNGQTTPTPTVNIQNAGSSQSFSIIQPTQVINYIISLTGTYPSRN